MGSLEAAPIPLQSVLANPNAVFLGFGQSGGRPVDVHPGSNGILGQPLREIAGRFSVSRLGRKRPKRMRLGKHRRRPFQHKGRRAAG